MKRWLLELLDCAIVKSRECGDEIWGAVLECRGTRLGVSRGILSAIPRHLYRIYKRIKSAYESLPVAPWRATASEFIRHMRIMHAVGLEELVRRLTKVEEPRVLALGCGWGFEVFYIALRLREMCQDFKVVGLDIARKPVSVARRLVERLRLSDHVEFVVGVTEWLPFRSASFHAVTAIYGPLDHTLDPSQAFREISRVLKPRGLLLATFLNRLSSHTVMWIVRSRRFRRKFLRQAESFVSVAGQRVRTKFWTRSEIITLARAFRFKIARVWSLFSMLQLKFKQTNMTSIERLLARLDYGLSSAPVIRWLGRYIMVLMEKD